MSGSRSELPGEGVIDACVFHEWESTITLARYMEPSWAQLVTRPGDRSGPLRFASNWLYPEPAATGPASRPKRPSAASSRELRREPVFASSGRDRVVLGYHEGLLVTAYGFHFTAREVVKAANDWTIDQWLAQDDLSYGMVLVSTSLPLDAAAEIRRAGQHPRMVAVAIGANALGRPFGHPIYHPIYEAASELSLPIVIQVGSDAMTDLTTPPVAGGLPATYSEFRVLGSQSIMSHVASLVTEGVFDQFPNLRVLALGCGAAWLPGYLWRLDYWYKSSVGEAPWLARLPSEYIVDHVRIGTNGLEWPRESERLLRALTTVPGIDRMLVYASGYPKPDAEEPAIVADRLPDAWRHRVMRQNAADLFRWPREVTPNQSHTDSPAGSPHLAGPSQGS